MNDRPKGYYEQEVVINLNADEEMATVYSVNPAWIRKMDALVKEQVQN